MKMSLRYTLVGLGALATLSFVGWLREIHFDGGEVASFLIGVLPNVAAAIAIPYVLLGIWIERNYTRLALFAGGGLIAWEFLQQSSRRLVFDFNDLGATLVGLLIGWLIFKRLTTQADTTAD